MSKLINTSKQTINNQNANAVLLRELYLGLGMKEGNYTRWVNANILKNDFFLEGRDWIVHIDPLKEDLIKTVSYNKSKAPQDYFITIDFAKHIAMMARTAKAHEYRNYFLNLEKTFEYIKFRRLDKKHQMESMELIHDVLDEEEKAIAVNYIKANTVVNKITSDIHKFPKMLKKSDMSPEMLQTRQKVLDDYVKAFELTSDNSLSNDTLRIVYKKQKLLN